MALRIYGAIKSCPKNNKPHWLVSGTQPHVSIKIKNIFTKIDVSSTSFYFLHNPENCNDLLWFMDRYPLTISDEDLSLLQEGRERHLKTQKDLDEIFLPEFTIGQYKLNEGLEARNYQSLAASFHFVQKRMLLGDDLGLGKTLSAILTFFNAGTLPAIVVVQTHLPTQWKEQIERFTNFSVHIIKNGKVYSLPKADIYIIKYSFLAKWVDVFAQQFFKSAVFDEVQELRIMTSNKYHGGTVLSQNVDYVMGMSATPVYNYGDEIFSIMDLINPGSLGMRVEFLREWAVHIGSNKYKVKDPQALGTYLREYNFLLRRTRADVGRELPPINKIVTTVGFDTKEADKAVAIATMLSLKVTGGSFMERGQAARELDAFVRHQTGVAKARDVAGLVRILLENNEPVLLSGWHRDVYDIWLEELAEYNPVMYTGSETPAAKEKAKQAFVSGETNLFIISNRSGIGLDGLQHRCKNVVVGELDWSPKVHDQLIARVDRDGQQDQVTAYFPICDFGSDPFIIDLLGLKSSQAHGIVDPMLEITEQYSDESRIKLMAEYFINKKDHG